MVPFQTLRFLESSEKCSPSAHIFLHYTPFYIIMKGLFTFFRTISNSLVTMNSHRAVNQCHDVGGKRKEATERSRANLIHSGERLSQRRDERQGHNPGKDMERRIHQAARREENAQSAVSCIERGSKRCGGNQKERLQYLAAGTAPPKKAGYGAITDRAADNPRRPILDFHLPVFFEEPIHSGISCRS